MNVVAVIACAKIAHTYMATEQLEKTAKALGHQIRVETHGVMGIENKLSESDIRAAGAVILAIDIEIESQARFDGLTVVKVPVRAAIRYPHDVFARIQG
jgi:fructose-specific phosphotransferase system IIB component